MNPSSPRIAVLLALCLAAGVACGQWVVDSIDIGAWGQDKLTYNNMAGVIYGLCYNGNKLFAIACSTNEVVAEVPLTNPIDIEYDSLDNKLYCTVTAEEDSVLVFEGWNHTRVKGLVVPGADRPVWDPVGDRLYVTCFDYDEVAVIDCRTDSVLCYIPVPGEPVRLTVSTRHRKLYCQNDVDMTVSVIDLNTNEVIRNVYTGSWYFAAAFSTVADRYYCSGVQGVAVICGSGDTLVRQIRLPQGYSVQAMLSVESESLVMVATNSGGSDSVFMIDVSCDSVTSAIRVSRQPWVLVHGGGSRLVYCASPVRDDVSAIAADGSRVLSQVAVSEGPHSLVLARDYEYLYVGHGGFTPMVYVIQDCLGVSDADRLPARCDRYAATMTVGPFRWSDASVGMLADVGGRCVGLIKPGHNDLSSLPRGVYILVARGGAEREKVVVLR